MGRATFVTAGEGGFNDSRKTRGAMRVLAISGSLRASSINSAVLRAAAVLAPPDVSVTVYLRVAERRGAPRSCVGGKSETG